MRRITILLADHHTMISAALGNSWSLNTKVVGRVEHGHALIKTAMDLKPDLVLVDVGMPLLNGLDAGRELKKLMPRVKLIFLTVNPDPAVASEALRIGASGYLLKNSQEEELLEAVRNATRGLHTSRHKSRKRWKRA